jgi:subtilisin family serine protease
MPVTGLAIHAPWNKEYIITAFIGNWNYSNFAGSDATVQKNFLVVGVEGSKTGLYGTSFAAPVITGYAAILGGKFTTATPTQVANQLLVTARQDTLADYSAAKYGRGEASLTRALAPVTIR